MERTAKINDKVVTIRNCVKSSASPCEVEIRKGDKVVIKKSLQKFYQDGLGDKKVP